MKWTEDKLRAITFFFFISKVGNSVLVHCNFRQDFPCFQDCVLFPIWLQDLGALILLCLRSFWNLISPMVFCSSICLNNRDVKYLRCQVLAYFQIIFIIIDKNTKVTAFVLFQLDAATLFLLYRICNLGPVPKINLHIYKLAQIPKIIGFIIEYRWDFLLMWRNVAETIQTAIYLSIF